MDVLCAVVCCKLPWSMTALRVWTPKSLDQEGPGICPVPVKLGMLKTPLGLTSNYFADADCKPAASLETSPSCACSVHMWRPTTVPVVPLHELRWCMCLRAKLNRTAQHGTPHSRPRVQGGSEGAHLIRPMQGPRLLQGRRGAIAARCRGIAPVYSVIEFPNPPVWVIWALNSAKFVPKVRESPLHSFATPSFFARDTR